MSANFKNVKSNPGTFLPDNEDNNNANAYAALPPHAAAKADHIEQLSLRRLGQIEATTQEIAKLTERKKNKEVAIARHDRDRKLSGIRYSDEDVKQLIDDPSEEVKREAQKIKQLRASTALPPTITLSDALHRIKPNAKYVDARVTVQPKDPRADLNNSRERIQSIAARSEKVKYRSRYKLDDQFDTLERDVKAMARKGEIGFMGCAARQPDVTGRPMPAATRWPKAFDSSGTVIHDGAAMLCYLFGDQIIERGKAVLTARHKPELSFTNVERNEKLRELAAEKLAEERREEALVELCEAAGIEVLRRPDANPLAVLGIALADTAVADAPLEDFDADANGEPAGDFDDVPEAVSDDDEFDQADFG